MDETWIVFLAGTIFSFALMMLVYFRVVLPRTAKSRGARREAGLESANRLFIDCLREEAIARVNDNLAIVVAQQGDVAEARTQRGGEPAVALRLAESRQTLQSLFSNDVVAAYDKVVVAINGGQRSASDAMRLVAEFRGKMAGYLDKRTGLSGEPAPTG